MAVRPVFIASKQAPFYRKWDAEFVYNGGFAVSQKQKNIQAVHAVFVSAYPGKKILEISSKSMQEGGEALSAFFLRKEVPSLGRKIPVENVFQAGKVFEKGGPFTDLLHVTPRDAKRDERLKTSGKLIRFTFEGQNFPLEPKTIFYDYIYISALRENPELAETVLKYTAFTDIEFNPQKSLNCQARAAAIFVSLSRQGMLKQVTDFESFLKLFQVQKKSTAVKPKQEVKPEIEIKLPVFSECEKIEHKVWGTGVVEGIKGRVIQVRFEKVGVKDMDCVWVHENCRRF